MGSEMCIRDRSSTVFREELQFSRQGLEFSAFARFKSSTVTRGKPSGEPSALTGRKSSAFACGREGVRQSIADGGGLCSELPRFLKKREEIRTW